MEETYHSGKNLSDGEDAIPLFLSFCIEQYKNREGINGEDAMEILSVSGALKYLENNYEVIHTQSPQWILEEIDKFLAKQCDK